jgi:hypothetical protein
MKKMEVSRKDGGESFHLSEQPLHANLLGFWRWAFSDLTGNIQRGRLAEYIVALALGQADGVRVEWDAYDLLLADGTKIEVKSSAYLQSWEQVKLSTIRFGIAPTLYWDEQTRTSDDEKKRQADIYVFCLLHHKEQETLDPMDLDQWTFFVLPTQKLNEQLGGQKELGLAALGRLQARECSFAGLADAIWESRR